MVKISPVDPEVICRKVYFKERNDGGVHLWQY